MRYAESATARFSVYNSSCETSHFGSFRDVSKRKWQTALPTNDACKFHPFSGVPPCFCYKMGENLINVVREYPCLWDIIDPKYKDRLIKETYYKKVAASLD